MDGVPRSRLTDRWLNERSVFDVFVGGSNSISVSIVSDIVDSWLRDRFLDEFASLCKTGDTLVNLSRGKEETVSQREPCGEST
jgi:hypothetical protein